MAHAIAVAALPLLTLLAGVVSLYIDPQREPKKRWILLVLLFVTGGGSVVSSVKDDQDRATEFKTIIDEAKGVQDSYAEIKNVHSETDVILTRLQGYGLNTAEASLLRTAISADKARNEILPSLNTNADSSITVVYYPKNVDGAVVVNALKQGGFQIETHAGNPANAGLETNSVWVGDSVTDQQAKFVALTLVRAGVKIVSIRRFNNGSGPKRNLIEIGTDRNLVGAQPLTVDGIVNLPQIPRRAQDAGDLAS